MLAGSRPWRRGCARRSRRPAPARAQAATPRSPALSALSGLRAFQLARLGGQQHGAAAERHVLVDMAVLPGDGERVERALPIAGARLHVEQRVDAPGERADRACTACSASARAASMSLPRFASRNRPRTPSSSVSGRSSMASKARRAAARSPLSCAACARSNAVSGSFGRLRRRCRHSVAPACGRRRRWRAARATARRSPGCAAARAYRRRWRPGG